MRNFVSHVRKIYHEVKYPYTESNMSYRVIQATPYVLGLAVFLSLFKNFFSPGPNFWSGEPIIIDFKPFVIFSIIHIIMVIIAVIFRKKL